MLHYYHIKIELRLEAIRVLRSRLQLREKLKEKLVEALQAVSVSYTHLTLPTN